LGAAIAFDCTYASGVTEADEAGITIAELARRTGMTVRNIRAHQSRGLLPPPEVRGRTGYYGQEHVARIELIKEMQADGFNLGAIAKLLESARGSTAELLRFTRAVKEPFEDEQPRVVELRELAELWESRDPEVLRRAEKLGLLRSIGGDRYEEISPRLSDAGAQLSALGVPVRRQLDLIERVRRHADAVAEDFVKLFVDAVWRPFETAGAPDDRWPQMLETLQRLRPLAAQSLLAVFQLSMTDIVDREFGRVVERMRT
jgi:DNA-binding transcriptional MerR regulator